MGDWPSSLSCAEKYSGAPFAVIADAGTANTKSGWQQIIAATPFTGFLTVCIVPWSGTDILYDIGIGAEGAEVAIISNLFTSSTTSSGSPQFARTLTTPILIPKGSRVSFRAAGYLANANCWCSIGISSNSFLSSICLTSAITIGATEADSGGTSVDPGGTIDTKGSWVEISSGLSMEVKSIALAVGNQRNTGVASATWAVDVGYGASPGDNIIVADYRFTSYSANDMYFPPWSLLFHATIPVGQSISVRAACSINDATDRKFDCILYCFG